MGVVCDDTEASVGSVFFHDSSKSHLSGGGHCIGLVEYDELEGADGSGICRRGCSEDLLGT